MSLRIPLRLAGAAALLVLGTACEDGRAVTTSPVGERAYGFTLTRINDNLPRGTARWRVGGADSVVLTLRGLDTLSTGFYTVWFGAAGAELSTFKRATASRLQVVVTDTATNAQGDPVDSVSSFTSVNVPAFQNGGYNKAVIYTTTRAASGLVAGDPMDVVLVTIEKTVDATAPGTHRPLWAVQGTPVGGLTTTNFTFGWYAPAAAERYVFPVGGTPPGVGRGYAAIRGNELVTYDSSLAVPPRGYTYTTYIVRADSVTVSRRDTSFLSLGPLTAPPPRRSVSLLHADSLRSALDPTIQADPPVILAAAVRFDVDTASSGPFANRSPDFVNVARVQLNLEPKTKAANTRPGPAVVLRGDVPGIVRNPR